MADQPTYARTDPRRWLQLLETRLAQQRREVDYFETFIDGTYPLPITMSSADYREEFRAMLAEVRDNWMPMVVDATSERLTATGFRRSEQPDADKSAMAMWQRNFLDGDSRLAHDTALATGRCPVIVWGNSAGEVDITIEHPAEVYVAYQPGHRRNRAAAIKVWTDDWTGERRMARVWTPQGTWRIIEVATSGDNATGSGPRLEWVIDGNQSTADTRNPLGFVPVFELRNRLRLRDRSVRSDLHTVTSTQLQIDKLLVDMLVASEFAAFRQRWGTGVDIPTDDDGNPLNPDDFVAAVDRFWHVAASDAKFGDFEATDLSQYTDVIASRIASLAVRTRTPPHYMLAGTSADIPNGETIKSAESGLISKIKDRQVTYGETWEEIIRAGYAVLGDTAGANDYGLATVWADPETRTEAEHVDAVLKMKSLDVPIQQLWQELGFTDTDIERFKQYMLDEAIVRLMAGDMSPLGAVGAPVDVEQIGKQATALGALRRAGVADADAAERVGLAGLEFTGTPAAIRPNVDAAADLEPIGGTP